MRSDGPGYWLLPPHCPPFHHTPVPYSEVTVTGRLLNFLRAQHAPKSGVGDLGLWSTRFSWVSPMEASNNLVVLDSSHSHAVRFVKTIDPDPRSASYLAKLLFPYSTTAISLSPQKSGTCWLWWDPTHRTGIWGDLSIL